MTQAYRNADEIYAEKNAFDFNKLLEPYSEGGTKDAPIKRTFGTIADYLLNKKKYPEDVAGAAILITFVELFKGKTFEGDGSYGSKGRELVTYMRELCDKFLHRNETNKVLSAIAGMRMTYINEFINREVSIKTYPRWKKIFKRKQWNDLQKEYQALVEKANNEPA